MSNEVQHTKNCIVCGVKADMWTGHVLNRDKKIIAGWCSFHLRAAEPRTDLGMGCYGYWLSAHGITNMLEVQLENVVAGEKARKEYIKSTQVS